jgi:hypothetical protein
MKHIERRPTRDDSEFVIRMLAEHYPKAFFEEPRQRRPLKQNILPDILADKNFEVEPNLITAAIDWYTGHLGYDYALSTPGSKRVDLDGREIGTVTEQEALFAQQRIDEYNRKKNQTPMVKFLNDVAPTAPPPPRRAPATIAPEFTPLYETLAAANAAVIGTPDPIMRGVVAKVLLDEVIKRCQQVRFELETQTANDQLGPTHHAKKIEQPTQR